MYYSVLKAVKMYKSYCWKAVKINSFVRCFIVLGIMTNASKSKSQAWHYTKPNKSYLEVISHDCDLSSDFVPVVFGSVD